MLTNLNFGSYPIKASEIVTYNRRMFFRRLLAFARSSGLALTLTIVLGWVGGLMTILQAWYLATIVNAVFLNGAARAMLVTPLGILLAVIVFKALSIWGAELSANAIAQRVKTDLRGRLLNHLTALEASELETWLRPVWKAWRLWMPISASIYHNWFWRLPYRLQSCF